MSSVTDFYADRSVFVTGFTGFLGKVLVEKLVRSCPDIKTVYCLVRPLKDKDSNQRTAKILDSTLFESVRRDMPKVLAKIVPINGDIMEENLGLSKEDLHTLKNNVTVVFHCAATVKFDEDLRFAMQMNVLGTQRLLKLCHDMKDFAAFVHTSTAYCNCNLKRISEKVYPAPVRPQKLMATLEWMNDDMVKNLSQKLLETYDRPNTYAFTKTLAEELVLDESAHLPITIVRPSMIAATWQEPMTGWMDNLNGTTGIITAKYKGVLRMIKIKLDGVADIIPVDIVSNMLIVSAWQRANMTGDTLPVLHCTSGQLNPLTWGDLRLYTTKVMTEYPLLNPLRYPSLQGTMSESYYMVHHIFRHLLPAYGIDFLARLTGSKPILVSVVKRMHNVLNTVQHFMTNEWYFASKNVIDLVQIMSAEDRKKFNIDIRDMDWYSYIENYSLGIRKLILKDELSTLPRARVKAFRYKILNRTITAALMAFVLRFLIRKNATMGKIWQYLLNIFVRVYRLIQSSRRAITV